ncbi:MAG TPA: leucyl aminopeptidase [Epulopiscium sp.]|nr:leucyl aminopeptidase [Candidatus Epulonipiscium sp.]
MNFHIGTGGLVEIITVFEGFTDIKGSTDLYHFITENDLFKAKSGDIYSDVSYSGKKVILLGLGNEDHLQIDSLRRAFYKLGKELMRLKVKSVNITVETLKDLCFNQVVQATAEGLLGSEYRFEKYLTEKKIVPTVKDVYVVVSDEQKEDAIIAMEKATLLINSVFLAMDLVNEPAITLTPKKLAMAAKNELKPLGVKVDVYGRDEVSEIGMKAFLAVSKGSAHEPQLIVMTWNGNPDSDEKIALVGKGLTYDSGGYSIKPTDSMVDMKSDMAGSAAVIGAMKAIATSNLKQNVVAIVAACENMISGAAYKPGDVISSMSGKTIEILNTDAEGRVTLADALWYATTVEKANKVIDVATLTGACVVALGHTYTGAITNNDELMGQITAASKLAGENIWQLPTHDDYKELIKGTVGDLTNTGGRGAGTITAGLFLQEFVNDTPWVHLDIAGTSFLGKPSGYLPKGATGVLVKTLYYLVDGLN